MSDFTQTSVIGAGVIGASWTALFLAAGKDVRAFDPSETARADVEDYVARAWPTLKEIGLAETGAWQPDFAETPKRRLPARFRAGKRARADRYQT